MRWSCRGLERRSIGAGRGGDPGWHAAKKFQDVTSLGYFRYTFKLVSQSPPSQEKQTSYSSSKLLCCKMYRSTLPPQDTYDESLAYSH